MGRHKGDRKTKKENKRRSASTTRGNLESDLCIYLPLDRYSGTWRVICVYIYLWINTPGLRGIPICGNLEGLSGESTTY